MKISAKKLRQELHNRGIYNAHYIYGEHPYIWNRTKGGSRDVLPCAWMVRKNGEQLHDAWYNNGDKPFSYVGREQKAKAFEAAKVWAADRFAILEWAKDPFGSWGDATFIKARIQSILSAPISAPPPSNS